MRWVQVLVYFLAVGAACLSSDAAFAEEYGPFLPEAELNSQPEPPATIQEKFYHALNLMAQKNFAEAANVFSEIQNRAKRLGYKDLSYFSIELLHLAKESTERKPLEEIAFLVRKARELSPTDSEVQLIAASFSGVLSVREIFSAFMAALSSLPGHVLLLAALGNNFLLLSLVSFTLAFLLVNIVQLLKHSEAVFSKIQGFLPKNYRGFAVSIAVLGILVLPLFFGILLALTVWGVVLAITNRQLKILTLIAGLLCLAWGLSLPILSVGGQVLRQANLRALESVNKAGYYPKVLEELKTIQGAYKSPEIEFTIGRALLLSESYEEAAAVFSSLEQAPGRSQAFNEAVTFNKAVALFGKKQFNEALELLAGLENQGGDSFELAYALALTHLGLLDTAAHSRYYALAKERDDKRLLAINASDDSVGVLPQTLGLSPNVLWGFVYSPSRLATREAHLQREKNEAALCALLFYGSSPMLIALFGIFSSVLGLYLCKRQKRFQGGIQAEPEKPSAVWLMIPAGRLIASDRPLFGFFSLGIFLIFLFAAVEVPLRLLPLLPLDISAVSHFSAYTALGVLVCLTIFSLLASEPLSAESA